MGMCRKVADDAASDCSTVDGDQEGNAQQLREQDSLSDCYSNSGLEVETLLIFDWDDTLFPTSWVQKHGLLKSEAGETLSNEDIAQLEQMTERVRKTLQLALQIGKVVLVTNAAQGWIEQSCTNFMPSLVSC